MNKLFVYGTLKKQHSRNNNLGAASFMREIKTLPNYTMIDLDAFPGILDSGIDVIYGELYEVDDSTLEMCDLIEGHPNFYERNFIKLEFDINTLITPYTYKSLLTSIKFFLKKHSYVLIFF